MRYYRTYKDMNGDTVKIGDYVEVIDELFNISTGKVGKVLEIYNGGATGVKVILEGFGSHTGRSTILKDGYEEGYGIPPELINRLEQLIKKDRHKVITQLEHWIETME